ncbi:VWA domain-containing protein [Edaphobacter aggregans]|uniref:VWA domain-containing protein n=1 Tax=Edaphobacter aggregans TaxID=570835 RepID=UPI00068B131C|nr:VWA domain-containing protein [Edaphobacter aggregans]
MHLRSRVLPCVAAALLAIPAAAGGWNGQAGSSANAAQNAAGQQKGQPAAVTQPSLTVDRDPVASPDPDTPAARGGAAGTAPSGQITREGGRYTLRADAYEVRLNATVLDSDGRSILTLDKDAFRVYEDGVAQTINSFRHEDLPVSLGIVIDSSGSMYDKRAAVEQAALDLIKLSNREDEAFVVDFSWEAFIDQDFTSDVDKLRQGLSYIKSSGGTAVYDALLASADYLAKNGKHPKQVLLVVTDGEDNASSASLEQAIRRIQDLDGPVIYSMGLLFGQDTDKRESRHAKRVLETLSEQTGGAAYFPRSLKDVDSVAAQVAQDIRTQYTIAYHSTKSPTLGGYRQIRVEAKAKNMGKLSVRTRTGYYPRVAAGASKAGEAAMNTQGASDAGTRP